MPAYTRYTSEIYVQYEDHPKYQSNQNIQTDIFLNLLLQSIGC